jgi:hypothetical protein
MKFWAWRGKIFWIVGVAGAAVIAVGFGIVAYAQTLGGTMTAVGAGAALGAAAGAGVPTAGQVTRRLPNGSQRDRQNELIDEAGNAGNTAGGGGAAGGTQVTVRVDTQRPLNWGPGNSGQDLVNQLMTRRTAPARTGRSARAQAAYSSRLARMSPRQRSRLVLSKYQKPPVGYLSWYLKEDRYKVTSKVWQFVTTPNDRFYYFPWAPAMKLRNPSRVIGFHTWQDAMIAGYRPDPITRPTPAPELTYYASLTRGPNLQRYFEFVYNGQIPPGTFDEHYRYVRYVAGEVGGHAHTRSLVGETVEQVLGALVGNGTFPSSVGGVTQSATVDIAPKGPGGIAPPPAPTGGAAGAAGAPGTADTSGGGDKRGEDYDKFRSRAGNLAR